MLFIEQRQSGLGNSTPLSETVFTGCSGADDQMGLNLETHIRVRSLIEFFFFLNACNLQQLDRFYDIVIQPKSITIELNNFNFHQSGL